MHGVELEQHRLSRVERPDVAREVADRDRSSRAPRPPPRSRPSLRPARSRLGPTRTRPGAAAAEAEVCPFVRARSFKPYAPAVSRVPTGALVAEASRLDGQRPRGGVQHRGHPERDGRLHRAVPERQARDDGDAETGQPIDGRPRRRRGAGGRSSCRRPRRRAVEPAGGEQLGEEAVDAVGGLGDVLEDDDGVARAAEVGRTGQGESIERVPPGVKPLAGGPATSAWPPPIVTGARGANRARRSAARLSVSGSAAPSTGPATVGPNQVATPSLAPNAASSAVVSLEPTSGLTTSAARSRGQSTCAIVRVAPSALGGPHGVDLRVEPRLLEIGGAGGVRRGQVRLRRAVEDVARDRHVEAEPAQGRAPRSRRDASTGPEGRDAHVRAGRERCGDARFRRRRGRLPRRHAVTRPSASVTYRPLARSSRTRRLPNGSRTTTRVPTGSPTGPSTTSPPPSVTSRAACSADPTSHAGSYGRPSLSTISVPASGSRRPAWPASSSRHSSSWPRTSR